MNATRKTRMSYFQTRHLRRNIQEIIIPLLLDGLKARVKSAHREWHFVHEWPSRSWRDPARYLKYCGRISLRAAVRTAHREMTLIGHERDLSGQRALKEPM